MNRVFEHTKRTKEPFLPFLGRGFFKGTSNAGLQPKYWPSKERINGVICPVVPILNILVINHVCPSQTTELIGVLRFMMRPRCVLRWALLFILAATFAAFSAKAALKYASGRTGVSIAETPTTEFMYCTNCLILFSLLFVEIEHLYPNVLGFLLYPCVPRPRVSTSASHTCPR